MELQITLLSGLILGMTQFITGIYPTLNKMNVTLIVTGVVAILGFVIPVSISLLSVLLALAIEVTGYNLVTKSIIPTIKYFKK